MISHATLLTARPLSQVETTTGFAARGGDFSVQDFNMDIAGIEKKPARTKFRRVNAIF